MFFIEMVWDVVKHAEIDLFYFRNAKVVGSTPIIGTHTTKSIKNNNLKSISLSSYDLLLRDSMTNSCRYG